MEQRDRSTIAIVIAQVAGALLIAAAARGDLWFDEIWSIAWLQRADGASDVFANRHDNNHILNSLYLWLLGSTAPLYVYRLLAVACGIGSLFVTAHVARRWGRDEALASVILAGTSYPLVLYFSEARGYAPAMFLALVAYALAGSDRRATPAGVAFFWIVSILGVLAHLTFIFVTAGLLVIRRPRYLAFHGVPLLFIGIWYVTYVRHMTFAGGPPYRLADIAGEAASLLIGTPERWPDFAGLVVVVAIIVGGAIALRGDGDRHWIFYPAVLLAAPFAVLAITRPAFLFVRYFVVTFPFFYLLLAWLICRFARAVRMRWIAAACVVMLVAAQSEGIVSLLVAGRGQYRLALERMSAATGPRPVIVGSDQDYITSLVLSFYAPRIHHPAGIRYVRRGELKTVRPEWFLSHTQDMNAPAWPAIELPGGAVYMLVDEYGYSGMSGWRWFLYRRATPAPSASRSRE